MPTKGAVRLPVLYLRVRRPHFDRHPDGTLEAGKLRARGNSVKSRVAPQGRESIDHFAAGFGPSVTDKSATGFFFCFPSDTCLSVFQSRHFFVRDKK